MYLDIEPEIRVRNFKFPHIAAILRLCGVRT
jgi:hypothetical protein